MKDNNSNNNVQAVETTASYRELSSQTYSLIVDHYAAYNQRALGYWKSVWEIVSRPYASNAIETAVQENFDRANKIVSLTVGELQTSGVNSAALTEKLVSQNAKIQDSLAQGFRGMVSTGISNVNFVKEATTKQFEDIAKRLDDVQARTAATVSSN